MPLAIHPSMHLAIRPSNFASSHPLVHTSICPSVLPSIPPFCIHSSNHLSINPLSIHQAIYPSSQSASHPSIHLFIFPSIHPFCHPSIQSHPFIHPPIHFAIHLTIHPSVHPSTSIYPFCLMHGKMWWTLTSVGVSCCWQWTKKVIICNIMLVLTQFWKFQGKLYLHALYYTLCQYLR